MIGTDLPEPPDISKDDPQVQVKQIRYQAQLDMIKAQRQAELDRETARLAASHEADKAQRQAELDRETARLAASHEADKAQWQAEFDRRTAQLAANYQTAQDKEKTALANDIQREKDIWSNEYVFAQAIHTAYIEVAKAQIDRNIARADFVQKAATAIGGAYTAIIGLSFAVGDGKTVLPAHGIAPTIFLGLAIALATGYISYLTTPDQVRGRVYDGTIPGKQRERRDTFILWTKSVTNTHPYLLRAAVISLGLGVIFLPAPYLNLSNNQGLFWSAVGVGVVIVFLLPVVIQKINPT